MSCAGAHTSTCQGTGDGTSIEPEPCIPQMTKVSGTCNNPNAIQTISTCTGTSDGVEKGDNSNNNVLPPKGEGNEGKHTLGDLPACKECATSIGCPSGCS